ncbi:MAG: hypothetical protein IPK12_01270 [Gemmatimonadetes bacterium]|nr:hypothetical protein [Gemmatimonadota bacterium]
MFTALNSGRRKVKSYVAREAQGIIDRVTAQLTDDVYQEEWKSYWLGPEFGAEGAQSDEVRRLIQALAKWLLEVNLSWRLIEVGLRALDDRVRVEPPPEVGAAMLEAEQLAAELKAAGITSGERAGRIVERMRELWQAGDDTALRATQSGINDVRRHCREGERLLAEVDVKVRDYGVPAQVHVYDQVAYIEVSGEGVSTAAALNWVEGSFADIRRAAMASRADTRLEMCPSLCLTPHAGLWFAGKGKEARDWLAAWLVKVSAESAGLATVRAYLFADLSSPSQVIRRSDTTNAVAVGLLPVAAGVVASVDVTNQRSRVIVAREYGATPEPGIQEAMLRAAIGVSVEVGEPQHLRVGHERETTVVTQEFTIRGASMGTAARSMRKADVGIITILAEEASAASEVLRECGKVEKARGVRCIREFELVDVTVEGGKQRRVVAAQSIDQGNSQIVPLYDDLVAEWQPEFVILLGTAGGISPKVNLCDVIVADQVIGYDRRKITQEGVLHRGSAFPMEAAVLQAINRMFKERRSEPASFAGRGPSGDAMFRAHKGGLAAGEAVLADGDADVRKWLREFSDKILAVETEAFGFWHAFHQSGLRSRNPTQGIAVVRGISDHADIEKDDRCKYASSYNAARVAIELVRHVIFA